MATTTKAARVCSVARTLEFVGEKWSLLAIREVLLGSRRFEDIVANTGAPRDTMSARLRTLVEHDILSRRQYSEHPPRYEYVLTEAGRDLQPVILSLMQWGDRHRPLESGPPTVLEHDCGHPLVQSWRCAHCGQEIERGSLTRMKNGSRHHH
jgi:DNA-binding HxlR family transcriptional regulator